MIIAGTGHRPDKLGGYSLATDQRLRRVALAALAPLHPTHVISGMALGWDMALAEAAVELGVPFTAAVPFRGQERAWPVASQHRYHDLLGRAKSVVYVSQPPYSAWKMMRRNAYMVDHCDLLLALWNGEDDGGTANCVKYARLVKHKPIQNVWDRWMETT